MLRLREDGASRPSAPGRGPFGRSRILEGLPAQQAELVHLSGAACREVDLVHGYAVRFLPEAEAVPGEGADQLRGHRPAGFLGSVDGELDDDDRVGPQEDTGIPDGQPGAESQLGLALTYDPGSQTVRAEARPPPMYVSTCPRGDLNRSPISSAPPQRRG